jgi:hypothetical protein
MLPIERKSVEPLAAYIDPWNVSAKHQSLHHVVAKSDWSDEQLLGRVREWVSPALKLEKGSYWIVDDTGVPKKGQHSVGVARQYCGQLGKNENCQVAVSLSLASQQGSIPIAWQLYLPKEWTEDKARCAKVGVPEPVRFSTKHDFPSDSFARRKLPGCLRELSWLTVPTEIRYVGVRPLRKWVCGIALPCRRTRRCGRMAKVRYHLDDVRSGHWAAGAHFTCSAIASTDRFTSE